MKQYVQLFGILLLSFIISLPAQQIIRKVSKGGGVFNLPEIGGIIIGDKGKVFFDIMMPAENRLPEYRALDIAKDDEIVMMNGEKITSIKQVEQIYNTAKTGEKIAFGLSRNNKKFMVSFSKADAAKLPATRIIRQGSGIKPGEEKHQPGEVIIRKQK